MTLAQLDDSTVIDLECIKGICIEDSQKGEGKFTVYMDDGSAYIIDSQELLNQTADIDENEILDIFKSIASWSLVKPEQF